MEEKVFGACAGAGIYRRSMLDKIGLFDEDFFIFAEDVDLNLRAQYHGFGCIYLPKAKCYHRGTATVGFHSDWHVSLYSRNNLFVLLKNYGWQDFRKYFGEIVSARFGLIRETSRAGQGFVVFKASFSFLKYYFKMLNKRRELARSVQFSFEPFKELIQGYRP